ncbi:hypothetical protein [Sandaracinus amylolyticus]|uniref:Uncharacterized protein n=1 Tax=Sandaracinus amylolyticus TaxID=927083 RepID=A0A0F6YHJ4_9BACT|nr:hypothetical protein [Sandaracinus amylolyticus]AKF04113.1 hypothetical protein DB32_001262 [Sandaracinus amylolyticus]
MHVVCPRCAAKVPARAVSVERALAKCESCDAVFSFEAQRRRNAHARERVACPASITVEGGALVAPGDAGYRVAASRGPLRVTRRWFSGLGIFFLVFSTIWNTILVLWYAASIASGAPWIMLAFPLLHVAVGLTLTYWSIAMLVNRTVVRVDDRTLAVEHGPLWWPGERTIDVARITQLLVRSRRAGRNGMHYALAAEVDGTVIDLLSRVPTKAEALYLEQTIEDHLSIIDDPSRNTNR